ncbi:hypothetical protein [Arthrobacter cheniae]|nr:hypothetical protein [Arthrobacter cheniae]
MAMTYFRKMTKRQAATALAEYLTERPVALQRLRDELTAHDRDPATILDGKAESLTPLWLWIATRITTVEDYSTPFDPDAPAPTWWPSWARYSSDLRRSTPDEVVTLLDGFISYLGGVVTAAAPEAVWQIGQHRIKAYVNYHHPVLVSSTTDYDGQLYLPRMVAVTASRLRRHMDPLRDDEFTSYATGLITHLRDEVERVSVVEEPLAEVGEEDGVFDIGLHEEIAHEHSQKIDRMIKDLAAQPGIESVLREDREVVLVTARDWDAERLERWVLSWLKARLPELN